MASPAPSRSATQQAAVRVVADTNVIVRFLVGDDAAQLARVVARADELRRSGGEIVIPTLVLAEVSWVLATSYGRKKADVAAALGTLLSTPPFVAEDRAVVDAALRLAHQGPAGIADYLLLAQARREGLVLLSFDRKLGREPDVEKP